MITTSVITVQPLTSSHNEGGPVSELNSIINNLLHSNLVNETNKTKILSWKEWFSKKFLERSLTESEKEKAAIAIELFICEGIDSLFVTENYDEQLHLLKIRKQIVGFLGKFHSKDDNLEALIHQTSECSVEYVKLQRIITKIRELCDRMMEEYLSKADHCDQQIRCAYEKLRSRLDVFCDNSKDNILRMERQIMGVYQRLMSLNEKVHSTASNAHQTLGDARGQKQKFKELLEETYELLNSIR